MTPVAKIEETPYYENIEHEYTQEIVCPWCGHIQSDGWEYFRDNDEIVECDCGECDKPFTVLQHISVTYSTYK